MTHPESDPPALHPEAQLLAFLLGTWRGEGAGRYPTIEAFDYGEEIHFWHSGKPFLAYSQRTWALDDGRPLHAEMGYWRPQSNGEIELVLAHPTGIVEIEVGTIQGTTLHLTSERVERTASAKEVAALRRDIEVHGEELRYDLAMAAVGRPLTHHLEAVLRRVD